MIDDVPDHPNILTDGGVEPISHLHIRVAGARVSTHAPAFFFDGYGWGHAQDLDGRFDGSSHIFTSITGPLQSVQRAEYWRVILALQASTGIHVGIDNLNLLAGVARLLQQHNQGKPLLLMPDGGLHATIRSMLCHRCMPQLQFPRSRVVLIRSWLLRGQFCKTTSEVTTKQISLPIWGDIGKMMLSVHGVPFSAQETNGIPSWLTSTNSW